MGEAESAESLVGEWGKDQCAMGEPEKDNSPVDCCPGERPSHRRLRPVPKRHRDSEAQGSSRRTPKPRVNRSIAKGPGDPLRGERACHGGHAPGFRAERDRDSEERLGPVPKRSTECATAGLGPVNGQSRDARPRSLIPALPGAYPAGRLRRSHFAPGKIVRRSSRGAAQEGEPRSCKRSTIA